MAIKDVGCNMPDERISWTTEVKECRKGKFFHYGSERVYFKIKGIQTKDKITVIPVTYLRSDAKFYLISKDGRIWHKTFWESKIGK